MEKKISFFHFYKDYITNYQVISGHSFDFNIKERITTEYADRTEEILESSPYAKIEFKEDILF